ncbi:MAG: 50S ribosomal protein L22 [Patescibacteria group bacterium]
MKALLSNYRQSPRKVRLVATSLVGKKVDVAMANLDFLTKRASEPLRKLLASAVANAKAQGIDTTNLIISKAVVNAGYTLKRRMPRARGTAFPINKRTSHVLIELAVAKPKETKKK